MKTEKCRYYNNAQTACTLMIDDLAGVAITQDGRLTPRNDWGYGMDEANSLWKYFERNLLERFPEIKGTVCFATQTYKHQNHSSGYIILSRAIDTDFAGFVNRIIPRFEFAFHGTTHGKYVNENNPELKDNFLQEFEYLTSEDIPALKNEIRRVEELLQIRFVGGKFCGYKKKTMLEEIFERFADYRCNEFHISVNYKAELIEYYIKQQKLPYNISFFKEVKPLGTAGSLTMLKGKINKTFIVSNCDILIDQDYSEILDYHKKNKNEITIVAALKHYPIPYGIIETGNNGNLLKLIEKPELTFQINSGMYFIEPQLINEIPEHEFFHITQLIDQVKERGGAVGVFPVSERSWRDIGEWSEYQKLIL